MKLKPQLERKSWSPSKIARALADREMAHARRVERQAAPRMQFQALLRALAAQRGGVRLLIHMYSGRFDTEDVTVRGSINFVPLPN